MLSLVGKIGDRLCSFRHGLRCLRRHTVDLNDGLIDFFTGCGLFFAGCGNGADLIRRSFGVADYGLQRAAGLMSKA